MRERIKFETLLIELQDLVVDMISDTQDQYKKLRIALKDMDTKKAEELIGYDEVINRLENTINERVITLIIRETPVASDLRRVITAMKISSDLERIADYVCNIAKYILHTKHESEHHLMYDRFFDPLLDMFKNIKKAYIEENVELALNVASKDEDLDDLFDEHVKELVNITKLEVDIAAEEAARALFVIKNLERAGDHLTNISEQIVYLHKAKRITLN
jgi:phosphate transport system protein